EAVHQLRRRITTRRVVLRRTRCVVVPSRNLQRIALEVWRLPPRLVRYIPNGIDVRRFPATPDPALLAQLPPSAERVLVGPVAALRPEKNLPRLLRAFAAAASEQPQASLVVAGDGGERAGLEDLAHTLGIADRVF